jgi:hypothetical protein
MGKEGMKKMPKIQWHVIFTDRVTSGFNPSIKFIGKSVCNI